MRLRRGTRRILEGTRALLLQSGLGHAWWPLAIRAFCFFINLRIGDDDHMSPYTRRHGEDFGGYRVPFGAELLFLESKDKVRQRWKFAARAERGIMVGYAMLPGGRWSGDYLIARLADLQ